MFIFVNTILPDKLVKVDTVEYIGFAEYVGESVLINFNNHSKVVIDYFVH